jgi:polar amino acid transport system substrate-binding protein
VTRAVRLLAWTAAAAVGALAVVACDEASDVARQRFTPKRDGVLTVAADLPADGFWNGDDPDDLDGGFEWAVADALAERFGLELEVINASFPDIVAGRLGDADLALAQVSITSERSNLTFSLPYYETASGVVTLRDADPITDLLTAREQTWAAESASTHLEFVEDVIRPDDAVVVAADGEMAVEEVRDGIVDAALLDLAAALVLTRDDPDVTTVARFDTKERFGVVIAQDTDAARLNTEAVDAALRALGSDGSLDDFASTWLDPLFESDPASLPGIRFRG